MGRFLRICYRRDCGRPQGSLGTWRVSVKEALGWSLVWVTLSLAFAGWLWWYLAGVAGPEIAREKTLEFLTGYLIEKSLSVDNIFVFQMLFTYFAVLPELQRRTLVYGVLGAIALRIVMILIGAWLIAQFHWIIYVFGLFLLVTGAKMLFFAGAKPEQGEPSRHLQTSSDGVRLVPEMMFRPGLRLVRMLLRGELRPTGSGISKAFFQYTCALPR